MKILEDYIQHLEQLASSLSHSKSFQENRSSVESALNGEMSKTLRTLVPSIELQEAGAFFTSEKMADDLVSVLSNVELKTTTVCDTACGGGNLLLAHARRLPVESTLRSTITEWGKVLKGADLHEEFVRATKARLMLLAALRGLWIHGVKFLRCEAPSISDAFPYVKPQNSLETDWPKADVYLLNPPFNLVAVPNWCKWSTGRVSQAALFIAKCLEQAPEGSRIRAILPDVLRSGSRYKKWRKLIEEQAHVQSITVLGQFDKKTHVDVFLLTLRKKSSPEGLPQSTAQWVITSESSKALSNIGDFCTVQVGRVVPYRDKEIGPEYPYLDVQNLPKWGRVIPGAVLRRFNGATFETPFVIVRRNSRAKDSHRAIGTIVHSVDSPATKMVAVENHLLVLKPKSGSIADCEALLTILQNSNTNDWLNERIRCRHLTVESVQSIPWWSHEQTNSPSFRS